MNEFYKRLCTATVLLISAYVIFFYTPPLVTSLILATIWLYIVLVECPQLRIGYWVILYPTIPFALLIFLNQGEYRLMLFVLVAITSGHDTGAYIAGKRWGRHKIAPTISPGKSWEGFVGGYIVAWAIAESLMSINPHLAILPVTLSIRETLFLVLLLNIAGTAGDFFESYLKRRVGIKDSGTLLPGHGGLLDRFDSLLFAIIALYIIVIFW